MSLKKVFGTIQSIEQNKGLNIITVTFSCGIKATADMASLPDNNLMVHRKDLEKAVKLLIPYC